MDLRKIPKIELHCHMDGSMSYEVTQKLAREIGMDYSLDEIKSLTTASMDCASLMEYLAKFDIPLKCIKSYEGLRDISYDFIKQAYAENIKYTEMRFAPGSSLGAGLTYHDIFEAVHEGLEAGKREYAVEYGIIVCAMRHVSMEESLEMLRAAKEHEALGVVAADIAGDEKSHTNLEYREFFDSARSYGMPFTIHSGECGNAENIKEAVELGAKRVGHGIAMTGRKDIIDLCVKNRIGVEMCPTSNLQTKAVSGLDKYPFEEFLKAGVLINVSTDNRTVSDTNLTKEYELLSKHYGLHEDVFNDIYKNSVELSFASDDIKNKLLLSR